MNTENRRVRRAARQIEDFDQGMAEAATGPDPRDTNVARAIPVLSREGLVTRHAAAIADVLRECPQALGIASFNRKTAITSLRENHDSDQASIHLPNPFDHDRTLQEDRVLAGEYAPGTERGEQLYEERMRALGATGIGHEVE